jgi:hypothetical protein
MCPELIRPENMLFPHEMPKHVSQEAHFQRVWRFYREHTLRSAIDEAVNSGKLSSSDADSALKFLGHKHHISVSQFVLGHQGIRKDLASNSGFQAAQKAFNAIGLSLEINKLTAEPFESQFWTSFDH